MEDNFGRKIDRVQITAQELLAETQNVTVNSKEGKSNESFDKLTALVEELSRKIGDLPIKELTDGASSWVQEVAKLRQEIGLFNKTPQETEKKPFDQSLLDTFKKYHNDFKNRDNGLWVGISKFSELAQTQLYRTLRKIIKPGGAGDSEPFKENIFNNINSGGRGVIPPKTPVEGGGGSGGGWEASLKEGVKGIGYVLAGAAVSIAQRSIELTGMHWTDALTGMKDLFAYQRNLDLLIYQKQRVNADNVKEAYKKQTQEFQQWAAELGVWPAEMQKALIETSKRGITLEEQFLFDKYKKEKGIVKAEELLVKKRSRLVKDSLFTASYLNMEIDSVNDMFNEWHTELGFSADQMSIISKEMIHISHSTGLVGKNLERALKTSEGIMKSMRGLGLLNATSAKVIMKMTADFQRFGFGEEGQAFLQKMTNGAALHDPKFGSLASRMAGGDNQLFVEIAAGRALNKIGNRKKMGDNLETMLLHDIRGVMGENQAQAIEAQMGEAISIDNLQTALQHTSAETQLRINEVIRQVYDNDIMGVAAIVKTFKESSKTYAEQVKELDDQIRKHKGNEVVTEKLKKRQRELEDNMLSTGFDYYREEMDKNKGDTAKAEAALRKRLDEEYGRGTSNLFTNMNNSYNSMLTHLKEQATGSGLDIDKLIKKQGYDRKSLEEGLYSKDQGVRDMAFEALSAIRQEVLTKEKAKQNPYENMEKYLMEINGYMQELVGAVNKNMGPWGPRLAIGGSVIASFLGTLASVGLLAQSFQGLASIGKGLTGWFKGKTPNVPGTPSGTPWGAPGTKAPAGKKGGGWFGGLFGKGKKGVPAPEVPSGGQKGFWKTIDGITSFFGGGGGSGRVKRYAGLAAVAAAGGYVGSRMLGGGQSETDTPLEAGQTIPVYVTNWEEICKCTGGISTEVAAGRVLNEVGNRKRMGDNLETTTEKEKTAFQRTSDIATASNNAGQWATAIGTAIYKTGQKAMSKGGQEVAEQLAIKGGQKLATKAGGKLLSKIIPGLDIAIDSIAGAAYAEENNRGMLEGAILGGLTGDSSVGADFLSPLMGVEKGTTWDKVLGVIGAGTRGAFNGAAIGGVAGGTGGTFVVPGVGTLTGAGLGALIGGGIGGITGSLAELYKIWTDTTETPQNTTVPAVPANQPNDYQKSIDTNLMGAYDQLEKSKTYARYGNGLDYTEETQKPYISSSTYNKEETVASMLEKQRVGKSISGSMPDMDSVNDYLTKTQSDKLDMMIAELRGIRTNTNVPVRRLLATEPQYNAVAIASRSNLKRASSGMTKGAWGLQADVNSQNDVLTDGRLI